MAVIEWFNVTYRSATLLVLALALPFAGFFAYHTYFAGAPREDAEEAIGRAQKRLEEATPLGETPELQELVRGARVALDTARDEFTDGRYSEARGTAVRSETLSLRAISLARGNDATDHLVRFYRVEGDVRVKPSGEFSWRRADPKMVLQIGDQVKTSSSASAQVIYFDGTVTTITPGSLLEIRDLYEDPVTKVRRVKEKLSWGELRASTQQRNVRGSYHEVATETVSAKAEQAGEFRVVFDRERKTSRFDVFNGQIELATPGKKETVVAGERVHAAADGRLDAKQALPGVPRLISPSDQRVFIFENPLEEKVRLAWEELAGVGSYHLMISDKALFSEPLYDAARDGTSAVIEGVPAGSYYWRVSAVARGNVEGPFSAVRRFRVSSQRIRDRSDSEPPELSISEFVAIGAMVIVNGQTEPGATLWVDNEKIEVYDDGSFYTVVRLHREGLNELRFVAQDTAGNETAVTKSAYVELY